MAMTKWAGNPARGKNRPSVETFSTMEMEPEDGSDDGILVANGYRAPLGNNWQYTTCELDENILHNLNGSGIAGLRIYRDSVIFDRNLSAGRTLGDALGISHCLIKLRIDVFPSSPRSLRELFEGLARNRSIQHLLLCQLDATQVDVFAIMLPFFEHNHNLRCVEILWSNMSRGTVSFITALSKCKRLERIVLGFNNYGFNQTRRVIASLRGHPSLLELKLCGDVEMSMATRMGGCVELTVLLCHSASTLLSLQLASCDIDDASLAVLSKSLAKSKRIRKINIYGNGNGNDEITANGWKSFSAALSGPTCPLETISLEYTRISDEGVISVGNSLTVNATVKHLNLTGSDLVTSEGWQRFARCLRNPNIALEELDIRSCSNIDGEVVVGLDDEAANAIGESLAMNTTLKKLDMSLNTDITSDGWIEFFDMLLQSKCSLEELNVSRNSIDDDGAEALVDLLITMRDFHTLHLRASDCTANGLRTFTRLLQPSSKVTTLDLGRNRFNDEVINDFANVVANNSTLTTLHIGGDKITDRSWAALSHALCDETSIENTYSSNHTLHTLEKFDDVRAEIPDNLSTLLRLNKNQDKSSVRRQKILIHHFHGTVRGTVVKGIPKINGMSRSTLPSALEWIGRDALGFSVMYKVVRGIPTLLESKFIPINVEKKMKYIRLE
jgi:Ran GTPase-activating protein (RanGAP) involved in mRNA processing and transport